MAIYELKTDADTVHGFFSAERAPILTIDPGDTVRYQTLDAGWGLEPNRTDGTRRRTLERRDERDRGHAMCGPVAIRGARPGMTLEIQINRLETGGWGWTNAGGRGIDRNIRLGVPEGENIALNWEIDRTTMLARDQYGHAVAIRPFMGVMGMPPAAEGVFPTRTPYPTGGNIDCKELVSGTTLYLPIAIEGALFSVGDGHAAQGDGEVSGTAIECPMDLVDLTFTLRDDMPISLPHAKTHEGWLTLGLDEDLNLARDQALSAMLDLIELLHEVDRTVALALASVVVDLRVTQMVNLVQGVHAVLPYGAIR